MKMSGQFYQAISYHLSPKIHQEQLGKAYLENDIWFILLKERIHDDQRLSI